MATTRNPSTFEVIGRAVLDVSITGAAPSSEGLLTTLDSYSMGIGGAAANVSVSLAYLGEKVRLRACVGEDLAGRYLRDELAGVGVDHRSIRMVPDKQTSMSLINIAPGGQIGVANFQGANAALSIEDLPAPNTIEWMHVAGLLQLPGLDGPPLGDYFAAVRSAGGRVSANLSRNTRDPSLLFSVLPHIELLFLNQDEAGDVTGQVGAAAANHLRRLGAKCVFVTAGPDGATVATPTDTFDVPAFPVEAVDTTGCGDAFAAACLVQFSRTGDARLSARYGAAAGAWTARFRGALPPRYAFDTLDALLPK